MMNQKAADLGCTDTHFVNANGLPDSNHYTTAWDLYGGCGRCGTRWLPDSTPQRWWTRF